MRIVAATLAAALACAAVPAVLSAQEREPADPPLAALLDSAALHQALLAAPAAPSERATVFRVYRVAADSAVEVIAHWRNAPREYVDAVEPLIHSSLRSPGPATPYYVALRVEGGPAPRIRMVELVEQRPELENSRDMTRILTSFARSYVRRDPSLSGQQRVLTFRARVGEDGTISEARLERGTGSTALDAEAMNVSRRMRFRPAKIGDEPVAVWITLPITLMFPIHDPREQPAIIP